MPMPKKTRCECDGKATKRYMNDWVCEDCFEKGFHRKKKEEQKKGDYYSPGISTYRVGLEGFDL